MPYLERLYTAVRHKSPFEFFNDALTYLYWKIRRTQSLEINGYSATFDADVDRGGAQNRKRVSREKDEIEYLIENIRPTDVVYDIGANIGLYTCFLSQHVTDGGIIAFEPYPPNVEQLRRNVSYNRGNVEIYEIALSNVWGTVEFERSENSRVGYGTGSIASGEATQTIEVDTAPGDDLINRNEIPQPNVVKIDVEGSEPLVIEGMEDALRSSECRVLICEVHLRSDTPRSSVYDFDTTPEQLYDKIRSLGFDIAFRNDHGDSVHLRCIK